MGSRLTRRSVLAGLLAGVATPGIARAQVTDLRGWDPLWRNGEEALHTFFGNVTYAHEGLELDLPQHADVGSSVALTIRIPAAMTEADYPKVVHVLAHGNPSAHVMSAWFQPASGRAEFSTRIRLEQSQKITAAAQMSDGRHIRIDREISVSFGACGQVGEGGNDDVFAFQPQSRVNVPALAKRGTIIPIRALISHPMETGMRLNGLEEWVRKRIISRFECTYNGAPLFRTRLYSAIATNPYFQFHARAQESGTFDFSWYDTNTDTTYTNSAPIRVAG
jgi:predicted secreted protein